MEVPTSSVALLIDLENLVRGVGDDESIDCETLFQLAEESGRVLVANAYADWRDNRMNQYQTDLYRLGVELIHVLGVRRGGVSKNAVDIRMAVDAISAISTLSHIGTYVIVSGDRDFIHVLKELRRHGKTIIGVSPSASTSDDFAALCDRFVRYEALARTGQSVPEDLNTVSDAADIGRVRQALHKIVTQNTNGILGSTIKPALRRALSPSFDESEYGFRRMIDLLYHMNDIVRVVTPQDNIGDIQVFPASIDVGSSNDDGLIDDDATLLIQQANLSWYRFEQDAEIRRSILSRLYNLMAIDQPFRLNDVFDQLLSGSSDGLSVTVLVRYSSILFHARTFVIHEQPDVPFRQRMICLSDKITSVDDFVRRYEFSVALKIATNHDVDSETLARVLGIDEHKADIEYCKGLLEEAKEAKDDLSRNK